MHVRRGFTLAELLIALVILGVIATFTIPKVLSSQQDSQFKATTKETAGMISGAYDALKAANNLTTSTKAANLTPYMNYVSVDVASDLDSMQGNTTRTCSGSNPCLRLHNGATVWIYDCTFNDTASTNAIWFMVDPDSKVTNGAGGDASATAPGKSVALALYYNGRLTTYGAISPGTRCGAANDNPTPSADPYWFKNWN